MGDITLKDQRKTVTHTRTIRNSETVLFEFKPEDAVVLSPALGMPAIVEKKEDGSATLELLIVSKSEKLQVGSAAFHLRISPWKERDRTHSIVLHNSIWKNYIIDKYTVNVSKPYAATVDSFGRGYYGEDIGDKNFTIKLSYLNVYPWVIEQLNLRGYKWVYKVAVKLQSFATGLYNIWWVNRNDYIETKYRLTWWKQNQHNRDLVEETYKKELKQYDKAVTENLLDGKSNENITANIYHPVYITEKKELNIGHITDVHMDTRMDIYAQSAASVIEVWENCKDESSPNTTSEMKFDSFGNRDVKNRNLYRPVHTDLVNYNSLFVELCRKMAVKGADAIVVTGDLVDYNRGTHSRQTYRKEPAKPGVIWNSLKRSAATHVFDADKKNQDRNWFLFYRKMLDLYDQPNPVPIFTLLGNHDYVNYGPSPWPLGGVAFDSVYDQNVTRYESSLVFGPAFNNSFEFVHDLFTSTDFAKWYTYYINPFADFVVDYRDQSLYMVDWAVKGSVIRPTIKTYTIGGPGSLHQAVNLFREEEDGALDITQTVMGTLKKINSPGGGNNSQPITLRNFTIYKSWVRETRKLKMLFMHATAICPRDDVSTGEIDFNHRWKDSPLCYGSFKNRRDIIMGDVEKGDLHMILAGHSHRNLVFEVTDRHKGYPLTLSEGEVIRTDFMDPKHLVMVTSSSGPLPKYLPGGPMICACLGKYSKYNTGYFYEGGNLFRYEKTERKEAMYLDNTSRARHTPDGTVLKLAVPGGKCPDCGMKGRDMIRKPARRHKPGANVLIFKDGKVRIETVTPENVRVRTGPMCEKHGVMAGDMRLEGIDSNIDYSNWDDQITLNIISDKPFKYYGHMVFPHQVEYVTFSNGAIPGKYKVGYDTLLDKTNEMIARQSIDKLCFEKLFFSAQREKDLAFARYTFSEDDVWDREVVIGKKFSAKVSDFAKNIGTAIYNAGQAEAGAQSLGSYKPEFKAPEIDEFKGMVLKFRMEPDFEKRKNSHVCGY